MDVCVIGAGVIGLSSAVVVQDRVPHARVTVIADKFGRDTTSYGSGGLIVPFAQGVPPEVGNQWFKDSADYFYDVAFSSQSGEAGVSLVSGFELTNKDQPPEYLKHLLTVNKLPPDVLQRFSPYKNGYSATTALVDLPVYLKWLSAKFLAKGGKFVKQNIKSFDELSDQFDVVVNCTGLLSHQLVEDPLLRPIRGQTLHLQAPWVKCYVHSDDNLHIFPFSNSVFVGSVKQMGRSDMVISDVDGEDILARTQAAFPPLKGARVLWQWVGLRPHRDSVRLEQETIQTKGKPLQVIHNYGHGSFGISLSWGCAVHVSKLVENLHKRTTSKL